MYRAKHTKMPNYVRRHVPGGTYFLTIVTHVRVRWLDDPRAVAAMKSAAIAVQEKWPFTLNAWVAIPDHLHFLITLPENDSDYSVRVQRFKGIVSKECKNWVEPLLPVKSRFGPVLYESRHRKHERHVWHRRFWEHTIRNQKDFDAHWHYIRWNPVKHGLCKNPEDWRLSSAWGGKDLLGGS